MSDYNFEEAFDDDEIKKAEEKKRKHSAKPRPGNKGAPKKSDVKKFKPNTFKGDPRTNFRIIDCCGTCKFSVFPKGSDRRGYCNLATLVRFRRLGLVNVLKVNQGNLSRNKIYAKYNWVRVHLTNLCTKHWLDEMRLVNVKRWIENGPI